MEIRNIKKIDNRFIYIIYAILYLLSFLLSKSNHHYTAGVLLILVALFIYGAKLYNSKNIVELSGLFSLSWIGGQGVACLQLSKLQRDWTNITWLCFAIAYMGFSIGYEWRNWKAKKKNVCKNVQIEMKKSEVVQKKIFLCIVLLAFISIVCFLIEAWKVGFIPLFSKLPHAYSYFHVSGVHYFTISCILIPALNVLYYKVSSKFSKIHIMILILCNIVAVSIPILCVSRFQIMFAILFALVTYIAVYKKITIKTVVVILVLMISTYVFLTIARNHDIVYLNGIFEMKNSQTPIFVTQPYIYIANNYDNFNCLVEQLPKFTKGLRMLFPFFALTGLKFVFPAVAQFPNYVTKTELTTFTMFYDGYYDFGIMGVLLLGFLIGIVASCLTLEIQRTKNPIIYLFYGQMAIYLALSFFTTWFSNPTTWFWFALTTAMYIFVGKQSIRKDIK